MEEEAGGLVAMEEGAMGEEVMRWAMEDMEGMEGMPWDMA